MKKTNLVDVSVANLITGIKSPDGEIISFAVRHPSDPTKPWQALSAGPKFPGKARDFLVTEFGADPEGFMNDDARCRIPESMVAGFHHWLNDQFYILERLAVMEWEPRPELRERMTGKYWGDLPSIITDADFESVVLHNSDLVRQPPPEEGSSPGGRGAKVRLFRRWYMTILDEKVASKIINHPAVLTLTEAELATTKGGRCIGWAKNGVRLANNLGVVDWLE
ncbi:hypothetical protein KC865_01940 [Candidatus Kaiserbacteria bacterium]|nr:hypothetical protein [Candidatus Kaiserbacteria bacterium]